MDDNPLGEWLDAVSKHDPLCVAHTGCFGCLLVELRSDATYGDNPEKRNLARAAMQQVIDIAQAHLDDARIDDAR